MLRRVCCCSCCSTYYDVESVERSKAIDKEIAKERKIMKRQVKILLLGAGESGKSTFLKQMRIIHSIPFTPSDLADFQQTIYQNTIQGMQILCDARLKFNIKWENELNEVNSKLLLERSWSSVDQYEFINLHKMIDELWRDEAIKLCFEMRNLFQLNDCCVYFFGEIGRLGGRDYTPTTTDILHTRRSTKGLHQLSILINNIPFIFYDIGGQRSQRSKWIQCLENGSITSLIYMVAASEYDQVLAEDRQTNRLLESQLVFDTLINNRIFKDISIILFLNKEDLLVEKITSSNHPIPTDIFPTYKPTTNELDSTRSFILELFISVNRVKHILYYHWTTAVNTEQIKFIFNVVKDTILKRNLNDLMLE